MRFRIVPFIFLAFSFLSLTVFEGSPDELDNGLSVLSIDKKLSDVKSFLVKGDTSKMISDEKNMVGVYYSSAWTVNLSKAKMKDYFGLPVKSIEVYFEHGEEESSDEHIQTFIVIIERPKDSVASEAFRLKVWDKYGVPLARMFSPDYTELVYDTWFNDNNRVLDLIYGIDVATGAKMTYYMAEYR